MKKLDPVSLQTFSLRVGVAGLYERTSCEICDFVELECPCDEEPRELIAHSDEEGNGEVILVQNIDRVHDVGGDGKEVCFRDFILVRWGISRDYYTVYNRDRRQEEGLDRKVNQCDRSVTP